MPSRAPSPYSLLVAALLLVLPGLARGDGVPVGPVPSEPESRPAVGGDGRGGAIVTWKTTSLRVSAVHVGPDGAPDGGFAFGPATLPLGLEPGEPLRASVRSESQVVLVSDRAALSSPVLTLLGADGAASAGFPVLLPMPLRHPAVVPGLEGRTLLVAKDSDAVSFWTLRAAIIGSDGQIECSLQLPSTLQFFNADAIAACSDGAGGLIAAMPFYDAMRTGSKDLAVFRLAADGTRPWGDAPKPVVAAAFDQTDVRVEADSAGGAFMVWTDPRAATRSTDIFALRLDADGNRSSGWQFYGQSVCDAPGAQSQPRVTRDGLGGVWVVWLDQRDDPAGDFRYSHVLGNGLLAPGFDQDGAPLCTAWGAQAELALAGDGAGGFFAVWRDDRSGEPDLYAQHVMASGLVAPGWPGNGRALARAAGAQDQPAIAPVGGGRAVVAWRDARDGTTRIYAAGLDDPATVGVPERASSGPGVSVAAVSHGAPRVRVTLPAAEPALLELIDVSGRCRARVRLQGPAERQEVLLAGDRMLEPGLYFARLRQGAAAAGARVTVLR